MPARYESDQVAKDHGNLIDLGVVEVQNEAIEKVHGSRGEVASKPTQEAEDGNATKGQVVELCAEQAATTRDSVT